MTVRIFWALAMLGAFIRGAAAQPLQCTANGGVPPTIRFEGVTEMVGDVVLTCTGGTPAKAGSPVPQSDVIVYLDSNVTNRILSSPADLWTDALLIIDEPHTLANPAIPLLACGDGSAPDTPTGSGICPMVGTGTGAGVYNATTNRPNVWQGRLNGKSSITWLGVPIDAPASGTSRVIRITNIRISSLQAPAPASALVPGLVSMAIAFGGANPVPIVVGDANPFGPGLVDGLPPVTVGYIQNGLISDVFYSTSFQQAQNNNVNVATGATYSGAIADVVVRLREGFQSAFKKRNWGFSGVSSNEQNQNIPGAVYNTESGFENIGPAADPVPNPPVTLVIGTGTVVSSNAFPAYHGMLGIGKADSGTKLMLNFANVPSGVVLAVPTSINLHSQLNDTVDGVAYLVSTDSNGVGSTRVTSLPGGSITGCSTNITSSIACPDSTGLALVNVSGGSGLAVYEVYDSGPFTPDQISIPLVVAYSANSVNNLPAAGLQTTVYASFGPLTQVFTATATDPVPRFVADSTAAQSLFTITKAATSYTGYVDTANCQTISGWAADRARLGQSISVSIYDGSTFLVNVIANQSRPDVGALLGDSGAHGFTYTLPLSVRDARAHSIHVVYETTSTDLPGSPKTLTCPYTYAGSVDSASCIGNIVGWAADRSRLNQQISVTLWDGSTQVGSAVGFLPRPDVGAFLGDNGLHGFSIPISAAFADGRSHTLQVQYETSGQPVYGSPVTLTCGTTANYVGYVDSASCSGITGWAADRNRLNVAITVSLWDGSTQIASTTAAGSRPDVGAYLRDQGLHAFTLALPPGYANGTHALQVRYESSATQVPGAAVNLTCASSPVNYAGYVDAASCSGITGWAADKNRLNVPLIVSLWSNGTQIASTTAGGARADVGALLGDNGLHGFSLSIPPSYATGTSRAFEVHYESSATQLPGASTTLTCGTGTPNYTGSVDVLSCSSISGWAADRNALNTSINVNIYDGSTLLTSAIASGARSDVGAYLGDAGLHGFGVQTPASLRDGTAHTITVRPGNSSSPLYGPQSLTCAP